VSWAIGNTHTRRWRTGTRPTRFARSARSCKKIHLSRTEARQLVFRLCIGTRRSRGRVRGPAGHRHRCGVPDR
jgi:hypothetical protein